MVSKVEIIAVKLLQYLIIKITYKYISRVYIYGKLNRYFVSKLIYKTQYTFSYTRVFKISLVRYISNMLNKLKSFYNPIERV